MKVTTDACLFGAWISFAVQNAVKIQRILDIGSGTGLLSLMLAQGCEARIDAVEMDESAFEQSKENFSAAPWCERMTVYHSNIINFTSEKKYDLIISNPPFFKDDLKSPDAKKNIAKHDDTLTLQQLFKAVDQHLHEGGCFAVLLPYHRREVFIKEAADHSLHIFKMMNVRQTPSHNPFRSLLLLSKKNTAGRILEMTIKNVEGNYSKDFIELLKDYYLYL